MLGRIFHSLALLALLCSYPFLSFWTNNLDEAVPSDLARYFALTFAGVAIGFLALVALLRAHTRRIAAICATSVVAGFSFHDVSAALGSARAEVAGVAWLVVAAMLLVFAFAFGERRAFQRFLLVFALARLALPFASLIDSPHQKSYARATAPDAYPLPENRIWSGVPVRRPDIYWFVFDSYPNDRVLHEVYEFDNRALLRFLEQRGFYIARSSYANFNKTKVSMATALNMEHAFEAGDVYAELHAGVRRWLPGNTRSGLSAAVSGDNRSVSFLRQAGYAYVHFDNRYWPVFRCRGFEDRCIRGARDGPSELGNALLEMTPVPTIRRFFETTGPTAAVAQPAGWATSGTGVPEFRDALAGLELTRPTFVYAHFTAPHPPFLNAADCRRLPEVSLDPLDFANEVRCVNRHLRELVEQVLRNRLGILSALHLPRECRAGLRPTLAPVNFMRIVFACLGGHPPRLTRERHFLVSENLADGVFERVRGVDPHAE
ncbi:MAG: hypothetical protein JRG80_22885 [Deltaproteobacteria bacterium]|nr:hypothetical protein [Deltaproteobacteria bacterium]